MNFKILDAIEQDNEAILKYDKKDKKKKLYKSEISQDNVMTSCCICLELETGMKAIAICTIINFLSAIWDLYAIPLKWYRIPSLISDPTSNQYLLWSMVIGWVITVLLPRIFAAWRFIHWWCKRDDFKR